MTKPFVAGELLARVRAAPRRARQPAIGPAQLEPVAIGVRVVASLDGDDATNLTSGP